MAARRNAFPNTTGEFARHARELVVIDPAVEDIAGLLAGVKPGADIAVLEPGADGVAGIGALLAGHAPVAALHIVSHGEPGTLHLGTTRLSSPALPDHHRALEGWRAGLAPEAEIILYGCRTGRGDLAGKLADMLGCTVAASSTPVGSADRGGDWDLDVATGPVAAGLAFDAATRSAYAGLFDPPPIQDLPDVFCFRITDMEKLPNDPEGDAFVIEFEVLNWSDQPASGLAIAAASAITTLDGDTPSIIDVGIDPDGRGGPLGGNDIGPGVFDDPAIHSGRGRGDISGLENDWVAATLSPTAALFDGSGFIGPPPTPGTPIPNVNLIGLQSEGLDPTSGVPGVPPVTDDLGDSAIDGGPAPFNNLMTSGPNLNGGGPVTPGDGNVLDGFTITIDGFDEGETFALDWNLLDSDLDPIGNAYGFGTIGLSRVSFPLSSGPALFSGMTGMNQGNNLFFDDVFFLPDPALFVAEFGAGISGPLASPDDRALLQQELNIQGEIFPNQVEALPIVTVSDNAAEVEEGETYTVTAELQEQQDAPVTLDLAVGALDDPSIDLGPTADSGDIQGNLSITIPAGDTSASTTLTIVEDGETEGDELLGLVATGASGTLQGLPVGGVGVTILGQEVVIPPPPENIGDSWGDPHLVTFDGLAYDFQAAGEFTLALSDAGDVNIQVRQEPIGERPVSVNTAVATEIDGTRVGLYVGQDNPLEIGNDTIGLDDGEVMAVGNGAVSRDGNTFTIVLPGADGQLNDGDPRIRADIFDNHMDIEVLVPDSLGDEISGLLGDLDGDPANDPQFPDGDPVCRPTFCKFPDPFIPVEVLYDEFAGAVRIAEPDSLFNYEDGESFAGIQAPAFPGESFTAEDLDPEVRVEAEAAAEEAGLEPGTPQFDAAVLDFGVTQDPSFFDGATTAPDAQSAASVVDTVDLAEDIFRFFNTQAKGHFFTIDEAERDFVHDNLPEFNFEGVGFEALPPDADLGTSTDVFRFFNTEARGHFFTTSEAERDFVIANLPQFQPEGVGFEAFSSQVEGTVPVFRFFNTVAEGHFFTTSTAERDFVQDNLPEFNFEGVGFYAFPDAVA